MRRHPAIFLLMIFIEGRSLAAPDLEEVVLPSPDERYTLQYSPIDGGSRVSNLRIVETKGGKNVWSYKGDGETHPSFSWSPDGNKVAISLRAFRWEYLTIIELRDGVFVEVEFKEPELPLKKDVPQKSRARANTAKCEGWTDNDTALLSFAGRNQLMNADPPPTFAPRWVDYKYTGKLEFTPAEKSAQFTLDPEASIKFIEDKVEQGGADQPATATESGAEGNKAPKSESEVRSQ